MLPRRQPHRTDHNRFSGRGDLTTRPGFIMSTDETQSKKRKRQSEIDPTGIDKEKRQKKQKAQQSQVEEVSSLDRKQEKRQRKAERAERRSRKEARSARRLEKSQRQEDLAQAAIATTVPSTSDSTTKTPQLANLEHVSVPNAHSTASETFKKKAKDLAKSDAKKAKKQKKQSKPQPEKPVPFNIPSSSSVVIQPVASSSKIAEAKAKRNNPEKARAEKKARLAELDQNELLASTWLNNATLKEKAEKEGLEYKSGQYTNTEKIAIEEFLAKYKQLRGITGEQMQEMIGATGRTARSRYGSFWKDVAAAVPGRPLRSVHAYVQRAYDPTARKGTWMLEEDNELQAAYMELGPQWKQIAERVDRSALDCKDRYTKHLAFAGTKNTGPWSEDETEQLRLSILEVASIMGMQLEDTSDDLPWNTIATKIGGIRTPQQCRTHWTDVVLPKILTNKTAKWQPEDSVKLVKRLIEQHKGDVSEVDWKEVPEIGWNAKSPHVCHKMFNRLAKNVPNWKSVEFPSLLEQLLKKAQNEVKLKVVREESRRHHVLAQAQHRSASALAATLFHESRYKSKEIIEDSDPDATDDEE